MWCDQYNDDELIFMIIKMLEYYKNCHENKENSRLK